MQIQGSNAMNKIAIPQEKITAESVNILIVDDKLANLEAMEAILEITRYRILRAQSGEEALKHLLRDEFACCLLDIRMPGMDGFETAQFIRRDIQLQHLPIIFVTAEANDQKDIYKAYNTGAVDFLIKPLEPLVVRSKVEVFGQLYLQKIALKRSKEIEVLNQQLYELNNSLQDANRDLEHFTHIAAHDMREPLRRQRNMVDLLNEMLLGSDVTDVKEILGYINTSSDQMLGMIDDFRVLTKIGYGDISREKTDFKKLIERCIEGFSEKMSLYKLDIEFDLFPGDIFVYRSLVKILYDNLMGNVINHVTRKELKIRFTAELQNTTWVYGVFNTGSTIQKNQLSHIFKMFRKIASTPKQGAPRKEGTGIGLSICKRVVDRHQGRIWAESGEDFVHIKFTFGD